MSVQLTREAYEKLIREDIEALEKSNCSKLEKEHIEAILKTSTSLLYD